MNLKILLLLILPALGCQSDKKNQEDTLAFINHYNKLTLVSQNDKCGEWGGDRHTIVIYRKDFKGKIYADYTIEIPNCEAPNSVEETKRTKVNNRELSLEDKQRVLESINQLCIGVLSKEDYPAHSGYLNQILLTDSSMVINDFPSIKWTKFEELANSLKN